MRALFAAALLLLASGCVSPQATESAIGLEGARPATVAADGATPRMAGPDGLLLSGSETPFDFRVWNGHDAYFEVYADNEQVQLKIDMAPSAYAMFKLDGPGACDDTDLGTATTVATPTSTTIDCGVLYYGWYTIRLSVAGGLARGSLASTDGHLQPVERRE